MKISTRSIWRKVEFDRRKLKCSFEQAKQRDHRRTTSSKRRRFANNRVEILGEDKARGANYIHVLPSFSIIESLVSGRGEEVRRGIHRILSPPPLMHGSRSNCVWHRSIDSLRRPPPPPSRSERNRFPVETAASLSIFRRRKHRGC